MKNAIAILWTISLTCNAILCAMGGEPNWFTALTALSVLTINSWLDALI